MEFGRLGNEIPYQCDRVIKDHVLGDVKEKLKVFRRRRTISSN